ncbi:MAG: hypothetical protein ACU85E_16410, partial [Gammaproteobacteria bacterium]
KQSEPDDASITVEKTAPMDREELFGSSDSPALIQEKAGKMLRLVRMMDGGACKNDTDGVSGLFLLYADPDDIERIKAERGGQVFAKFEREIEVFASVALQQAVNKTRFVPDPFALGIADAQLKIARQLLEQFDLAITPAIENFQHETTLTIEVTPFFSSLVFYTEGCDATHLHQEDEE